MCKNGCLWETVSRTFDGGLLRGSLSYGGGILVDKEMDVKQSEILEEIMLRSHTSEGTWAAFLMVDKDIQKMSKIIVVSPEGERWGTKTLARGESGATGTLNVLRDAIDQIKDDGEYKDIYTRLK